MQREVAQGLSVRLAFTGLGSATNAELSMANEVRSSEGCEVKVQVGVKVENVTKTHHEANWNAP